MPQGYDGLPPSYIGLGSPLTPNLGLSLAGMDPLIAENFWLIDVFAGGGGGTSVFVNSVSVSNPNFNNATPTAPPGFTNVLWQVTGSNVSAYVPNATPGGNSGDVQFNNSGSFAGTDNFFWDNVSSSLVLFSALSALDFQIDDGGINQGQTIFGIAGDVSISGAQSGQVRAISIPMHVVTGGSVGTLRGINITASASGGGTVGTYIGLNLTATGTITSMVGINLGDFSNAGDINSRAITVAGGIVELTDGTCTFAVGSNPFVRASDFTTGFNFQYTHITPGNIWEVFIPDSDSSTAVDAPAQTGRALGSFSATTGTFGFVDILVTNGTLYLDSAASPVGGGYLSLITTFPTTVESTSVASGNIGSGQVLAAAFSSGPLSLTTIPAGQWTPSIYASVDSLTQGPLMIIEAYTRTGAGVETLQASFSVTLTSTAITLYTPTIELGNIAVSPGDRVVLKVYLQAGGAATRTLTIYYDGSTHVSHMHLPTSTLNTVRSEPVNAQTGTTYTVSDSDRAFLVTLNNASAVAVTLPQANSATFINGWFADFENLGAGAVTITPTTSTIDGVASVTLLTHNGLRIISDGTNYFTVRGLTYWNRLGNATGNLTLANAGFATTFNQTSAVNWTWANTTAATNVVSQSSPILTVAGQFWNGAASAVDQWNIQNIVGNGTNGTSELTFTRTSTTTGKASIVLPQAAFLKWTAGNGPASPGNADAGFARVSGVNNGSLSLYTSNGNQSILNLFNGGTNFYQFASNLCVFTYTNSSAWTIQNTTAATNTVSQSSPAVTIAGRYWTGAASAVDQWTIQNVVANGTNGTATLSIAHSGSTGVAAIEVPAGSTPPTWGIKFAGLSNGISATASNIYFDCGNSNGGIQIYSGSTQLSVINHQNSPQNNSPALTAQIGGAAAGILGRITTQVNSTAAFAGNPSGVNFAGTTAGTQYAFRVGLGTTTTNGCVRFIPASGATNFAAVYINPEINQTGTASGNYTGLLVNVVETALKGTANLLLDLQAGATGGTSQFSITNTGVVSNYAASTLQSQGLPSIIAIDDKTAQSAAITATNLTASAPRSGRYRVSYAATVTTVDAVSSVLGGTNGFQVIYTSPTDSVAKTTVPGNSVTSAGNTTATAVGGDIMIHAKTGTAIQYKYDYTSNTPGQMVYELHVTLEAL